MVKSIALILATLTAPAAHPLHTSYTEIVRDARTGALTVSVRLFADDFGAAIASMSRLSRGAPVDYVVRSYFDRAVAIAGSDGRPIALAWCGMRSVNGLTWLCARSVGPAPAGKLRVRNALMFDRFADQVSIVRWTGSSGARTFVLSASAAEAVFE